MRLINQRNTREAFARGDFASHFQRGFDFDGVVAVVAVNSVRDFFEAAVGAGKIIQRFGGFFEIIFTQINAVRSEIIEAFKHESGVFSQKFSWEIE